MALKYLILFTFLASLNQALSVHKPEVSVDNIGREHSVLKLNEGIQILGDERVEAINNIVTRVERNLLNSRYRGASSSASPIRSLPLRVATKSNEIVDPTSETNSTENETGRQIQQWQVAVVVPPGLQQPGGLPPAMHVSQGSQPPAGSIWIQIPGYYGSNQTPIFYPGAQPTPVEQSPPMPSETTTENSPSDKPSNIEEISPENEDQHSDNQPSMPSNMNEVPEDGMNDTDMVTADGPNTETEQNNHNQISESSNEDNVSNNQDPSNMDTEDTDNHQPMNGNEPHGETDEISEEISNQLPATQESQVSNENHDSDSNTDNVNVTPEEIPAVENNYPSQHQEMTPGVIDNDSDNNEGQEEAMPPKMNMSQEEFDNAGQIHEVEQEMSAAEHPTDNNEQMGGDDNNIGVMTPNRNNQAELLQHCGSERGQYPSWSSCRKFVNCWDGTAVEQECPSGLVFSTEGFCDFRQNVNCGDRPDADPVQPKSCHDYPYGSFRNPNNCSEFFVCVYKDPIKFSCPEGLKYNDDIGVCDFPYRVKCYNYYPPSESQNSGAFPDNGWNGDGGNGIDGGENSPAAEEATTQHYALRKVPAGLVDTGLRCRRGSVVPLGKGCGRVSICAPGGFSQLVTCPERTAYDRKTKRCIAAQKAKC